MSAATPRSGAGTVLATCLAPLLVLAAGFLYGEHEPYDPVGAAEAADRIRPGRAYAHLEWLQSELPHRAPGDENYAKAPAMIGQRFFVGTSADEVQLKTRDSTHPSFPKVRNLHVRVTGEDSSRAIVLAAHWDTVPGAPGAIDDGGAIAILMEVADALGRGPDPACDIDIVVFDAEEAGWVGSRNHTAELDDAERNRIRAAVALELVGWKNDQLVVHTLPHAEAWDRGGVPAAWLPTHIAACADITNVRLDIGDRMLWPWYQAAIRLVEFRTGGDSTAYLEKGIPAAMIAGSSLTHFYEGYHLPSDSIDMVDSRRLDDVARLTAATAWELAALTDGHATRSLGDAYFVWGNRAIDFGMLLMLAFAAAFPAIVAGMRIEAASKTASYGLLVTGGLTIVGAGLGSVAAVLAGVPAVVGLALVTAVPRLRAVPALLGVTPMLVLLAMLIAGVSTFGGIWRAGIAETIVLVALFVAAIMTAFSVVRAACAGPAGIEPPATS